MYALGILLGVDVAAADGQRATGADDLALSNETFVATRPAATPEIFAPRVAIAP